MHSGQKPTDSNKCRRLSLGHLFVWAKPDGPSAAEELVDAVFDSHADAVETEEPPIMYLEVMSSAADTSLLAAEPLQ